MRTTISIDNRVLAEAKIRAATSHRTLAATIEDALRLAFGTMPIKQAKHTLAIPESGSGGLQPGVDLDDTKALHDRMEGRA